MRYLSILCVLFYPSVADAGDKLTQSIRCQRSQNGRTDDGASGSSPRL